MNQNRFVSPRDAFTLIEMLVALTIVGILVAILLPAVQSARESARRMRCASNLKQIGIALAGYEQVVGSYPLKVGYSAHVMILPWLEQKPLYDSMNFDADVIGFFDANMTVRTTTIAAYVCPSDDKPIAGSNLTFTAYGGNAGVHFHADGQNGMFGKTVVKVADVKDGLSNTAAMTEFRTGSLANTLSRPERAVFELNDRALRDRTAIDAFAAACRAASPPSATLKPFSRGSDWVRGDVTSCLYYHHLPPNQPACTVMGHLQRGTWPAGSFHGGKVHTVLGDGHVRTIKDTIDPAVWRALGTRNGGEVLKDGEF